MIGQTTKRRFLGVMLAVGLMSLASLASALLVSAGAESSAPQQSGSGAVPGRYSGVGDPQLLACMQTHAVCNPAAAGELVQVFSSPLAANAAQMGRTEAEAAARSVIGAPPSAPTFSSHMSGSRFLARFSVARSVNVDESRPVWVVTVEAPVPISVMDGILSKPQTAYSAVIDAGSGIITTDCLGCVWLTSSE